MKVSYLCKWNQRVIISAYLMIIEDVKEGLIFVWTSLRDETSSSRSPRSIPNFIVPSVMSTFDFFISVCMRYDGCGCDGCVEIRPRLIPWTRPLLSFLHSCTIHRFLGLLLGVPSVVSRRYKSSMYRRGVRYLVSGTSILEMMG